MFTLKSKESREAIKRDCPIKCSAVYIAIDKKTNELFFVAMHKLSKEPAKWYKVTPYVINGLVRVYEVLYEYTDDFVYSNFTIAKP